MCSKTQGWKIVVRTGLYVCFLAFLYSGQAESTVSSSSEQFYFPAKNTVLGRPSQEPTEHDTEHTTTCTWTALTFFFPIFLRLQSLYLNSRDQLMTNPYLVMSIINTVHLCEQSGVQNRADGARGHQHQLHSEHVVESVTLNLLFSLSLEKLLQENWNAMISL